MQRIKYVWLNIRALVKKRPLLALMIVLSQMAAILSVYISVELINNSLQAKQEAAREQLSFHIDFYGEYEDKLPETAPVWADVKDKFTELYVFLGEDIESLGIIGAGDNKECGLYSGIVGGSTGAVGPRNSCYAMDTYNIGDVFTVFGTDYTVISVSPTRPTIVINFDDYPSQAKVASFNIQLNYAVSSERIEEIRMKIAELFPENKMLGTPKPITLLQIQIDNMFIITSAFILLIAVVNVSVYFSFLFRKREKQTAILKICGAGRGNIFLISLTEMLGSYIISLILALIAFHFLLPPLTVQYSGFSLFEDRKYIVIFALAYLFVSAASVMLSYRYSLASPAESYKRAQKGGV